MGDTSITSNPEFPLPADPAPGPPPSPPKRSRKPLIILLLAASHLAVLLLSLGVGFGLGCLVTDSKSNPLGSQRDSIAILPFTGEWQGGGDKVDWQERSRHLLAVTIPDAVVKDLVALGPQGSLRVIATHEILAHIPPNRSPSETGRSLGVKAVLSGKVSRDGELTVQLISCEPGRSGELLWSKTYKLGPDQNGAPTFQGANDIANQVRHKLASRR